VTAVLPLFPYSRQPDLPYNKAGAPLSKPTGEAQKKEFTFESLPTTPGPGMPKTPGLANGTDFGQLTNRSSNGANVYMGAGGSSTAQRDHSASVSSQVSSFTTHDYENPTMVKSLQAKPWYKQWVAQAGTLIANLLTCAGADHVITLDLHDPQYQGFFDVPVDNLYSKPLLKNYIQHRIPNYKDIMIVSPDAGGAKRATAIAEELGTGFALIHKV
jgi:ribose-phosphate pyrophosphokinase